MSSPRLAASAETSGQHQPGSRLVGALAMHFLPATPLGAKYSSSSSSSKMTSKSKALAAGLKTVPTSSSLMLPSGGTFLRGGDGSRVCECERLLDLRACAWTTRAAASSCTSRSGACRTQAWMCSSMESLPGSLTKTREPPELPGRSDGPPSSASSASSRR